MQLFLSIEEQDMMSTLSHCGGGQEEPCFMCLFSGCRRRWMFIFYTETLRLKHWSRLDFGERRLMRAAGYKTHNKCSPGVCVCVCVCVRVRVRVCVCVW